MLHNSNQWILPNLSIDQIPNESYPCGDVNVMRQPAFSHGLYDAHEKLVGSATGNTHFVSTSRHAAVQKHTSKLRKQITLKMHDPLIGTPLPFAYNEFTFDLVTRLSRSP